MNLKRRIIRSLLAALPQDKRQALADDFVDWLFADLPPADRQKKAERIAPRLMQWISEIKPASPTLSPAADQAVTSPTTAAESPSGDPSFPLPESA